MEHIALVPKLSSVEMSMSSGARTAKKAPLVTMTSLRDILVKSSIAVYTPNTPILMTW